LNNSGTIESCGSFAVFFSAGNDRLFNTGTIIGNILLGLGNDLYDGTAGFISGRVDGGTGNDTIFAGDDQDTSLAKARHKPSALETACRDGANAANA
jgi:hypothetical protein